MKAFTAGLLNSVVSSYDKTKTTIAGRVFQKNLNSQSVLGPPLTQFIDIQTLVGFVPSFTFFNPTTNRLYVLSSASAAPVVALFNFNSNTGAYSYVGQVTLRLANAATTTHTFRGFKVDDSNAANIKIFLASTGSIGVNGGTYMAYGLTVADFSIGGTALWSAQSTGQKAVYFLQDPSAAGSANVAISSWGIAAPFGSSNAAYNTKVYQINGTLAAPVIYSWDYSGVPTVANTLSAVSAATTAYASTSPVAYFTSGAVNPSLLSADQVILANTAPLNFTVSTGNAAQTVYFIRDVQLVGGSYYFNLATTTAGAAVVPTSAVSGITLMRAFGISTNLFSYKTGTLAPALSGTILQANSFGFCMPTSVPSNPSLNGLDCFYVATSTTLYLFKASDVANAAVSWSVAPGASATGTGVDITAPAVAFAIYSTELDRWIYLTNTSTFVIKPSQAGVISQVFGGLSDQYMEGLNLVTVPAAMNSVAGMDSKGGWLFIAGNTVGQRGVIAVDIRSDDAYSYSYITSPVLNTAVGSVLRYLQTLEQLFDYTDSVRMQVRSATSASDALFNSPTSGWVDVSAAKDFNTTFNAFFQFRIGFYVNTFFANSPAQIAEIQYSLQMLFESSDYWALDNDLTTQGTNTPSYVTGSLVQAYPSAVPTIFVRGFDINGNQLFQYDTVTNATAFQYSSNAGTSWSALGTIPNAVGTRLRLLVASPPNQQAYITFRES